MKTLIFIDLSTSLMHFESSSFISKQGE